MNIKRFGIKGLLSFKDEVIFDLEPNTIYFVTGRNGSGKSTLFTESFSFLIDGKPYRSMVVKNIMNDEVEQCDVWIEDEQGHELKRIKTIGESYNITLDGKEITQERLNSIIGLEKDLFFNSVIFGQGFGGFVYFKDKDRKEFITKLSLGFVDKYIESILEKEKLALESMNTINDSIGNMKGIMSEIDIYNFKKMYDEYEEQALEKRKSSTQKVYGFRKETIELGKELKNIQAVIKTNTVAIIDAKSKKASLEIEYREISKKLQKINSDMIVIRANIDLDLEHIKSLNNTDKCHFCYSEITHLKRNSIIVNLDDKISKAELKYDIKYSNKAIADDRLNEISESIVELEKYIENMQNSYLSDAYEEAHAIEKRIHELGIEIDNEEKSCDTSNPYKDLYTKALNKIKEYNVCIEDLNKKSKEHTERLRGYKFWNEKLRNFKSYIFSDILNSLGILSNEYLEFLTNGKFGIRIDSKIKTTNKRIKDVFELEITQKGGIKDFSRLSGGEKRAVSLSVNIAFVQIISNYLAKSFNFIVLDEIFENLDEFVKEKVVSLIEKLKDSTGKSIIIITHDNFELSENSGIKKIEVYNMNGVSNFREI